MITISDNHYKELAGRLLDSVGGCAFFNGSVEYDTEEFYSTLTATLIVYTETVSGPQGSGIGGARITDIVPVWWEYHLGRLGSEELTDFSWSEFKQFLL